MPDEVEPGCANGHTRTDCSGEVKYKVYGCATPQGSYACASAVEDPNFGTIVRWQRLVDDNKNCQRCGRPVRYCWSWIPI